MGKKKEKKDKKKKKDDKKKKDKKKKDKKTKKSKKQESSSSSSSSSSASAGVAGEKLEKPDAKKRKKEKEKEEVKDVVGETMRMADLAPPEEGIRRFIYEAEETGPLGLRMSGGFPPLILAVIDGSLAKKKGIPANWEVHAVNGHALVPQNHEVVMGCLKSRPVALDVRPQGWKPKEKVREIERRREREEAEKAARVELEEKRREQVAREAAEQAEREAAERAVREEQERIEYEKLEKRAREQVAQQRAKEEEFERELRSDPEELRRDAEMLMKAQYGSDVQFVGRRRGLPLRLVTRQKEVAWLWAGEVQELIGQGVQEDPQDTWS